jgi:hypothetical protein
MVKLGEQMMKLVSGTRLFLLLATLVMSWPICAQETPAETVITYQSGEQLINRCRAYLQFRRHDPITQQGLYDSGVCLGYVMGVVDLVRGEHEQAFKTNKVAPICLPEGISGENLTDIVARYLIWKSQDMDQNPTVRHLPGGEAVIVALANTLPCKR